MLEAFVLLLKLIWIVRNAVVYVPGWHCAHHFVGSFFFHSSLICLTISLSLSFFLSFFFSLLNYYYYYFSYFFSFVYFVFFGCVRRFGECRMCPKLFFDFNSFYFFGIFFRVVAQQKQHTYTQHKCPQWIIDILRTRAAHLNEHNLRKSVWKGGREASNTYRENRLIYRPEICGTKV